MFKPLISLIADIQANARSPTPIRPRLHTCMSTSSQLVLTKNIWDIPTRLPLKNSRHLIGPWFRCRIRYKSQLDPPQSCSSLHDTHMPTFCGSKSLEYSLFSWSSFPLAATCNWKTVHTSRLTWQNKACKSSSSGYIGKRIRELPNTRKKVWVW